MTDISQSEIVVVGVGGMGTRHVRAAKMLGAKVTALCDANPDKLAAALREAPQAKTYTSIKELIDAGAHKADLVCVVTNTPVRVEILIALAQAASNRVLTEKPFTTNVKDAHTVTEFFADKGISLTVNTFRHFCDNHVRLRQLLRSGNLGQPRHISIQSASTGLGNMGSVFFDIMNFYIDNTPVEIRGTIDKTGTPSPRGSQFKDPGGFGMVRYENGARGFIDTSEDTGIPYSMHIATTFGRIFVDELFGDWKIAARSNGDKKNKPLTNYLTELKKVPFELTHDYDPVEMTSFAIKAILNDHPEVRNARAAVTVMEMIMAMHISDSNGGIPVSLPLDSTHHNLDIPFA